MGSAAALAVIETISDEDLLKNAEEMGEKFMDGLKEIAIKYSQWIEGVRGIGLMNGLVLKVPAVRLQEEVFKNGLLSIATAQKVLRLLPPMIIQSDEVEFALDVINKSCADLNDEMILLCKSYTEKEG